MSKVLSIDIMSDPLKKNDAFETTETDQILFQFHDTY